MTDCFVAAPLVGPFPAGVEPETYDRLRRRTLWRMPTGIYLLGSVSGGRRNLMTHNLAIQVATEPKLLAVAVRVDALTHELVHEGGVFSLCFLKREDRALVRGFTKPAAEGPGPGMLGGVEVRSGSTGAPGGTGRGMAGVRGPPRAPARRPYAFCRRSGRLFGARRGGALAAYGGHEAQLRRLVVATGRFWRKLRRRRSPPHAEGSRAKKSDRLTSFLIWTIKGT